MVSPAMVSVAMDNCWSPTGPSFMPVEAAGIWAFSSFFRIGRVVVANTLVVWVAARAWQAATRVVWLAAAGDSYTGAQDSNCAITPLFNSHSPNEKFTPPAIPIWKDLPH